jgi:hypothetical protein
VKKLLLVALMALALGAAAFADHEGLGIGGVGGGGGGFGSHGYGNVGLSLKIPQLPVFWGLYANFLWDYPGFGVTADFYFFDTNLVTNTLSNEDGDYNFKLDWYFGVGGFFNMYIGKSVNYFDAGVRLPIGLSWHIIRQLELFFDVAPNIGITNWRENLFHFGIVVELGLRYWINS